MRAIARSSRVAQYVRNFNRAAKNANRKSGGTLQLTYSQEGLAAFFEGRWAHRFKASPEYEDALRKIGVRWLRTARRRLRATKASRSSAMTGHLSKSLFFDIKKYQPTTRAVGRVSIGTTPGTRANDYFMQREFGGALPRTSHRRMALPFRGGAYFDKISRFKSGQTSMGVRGIIKRLNLDSAFSKQVNLDTWIVFGRRDEKAEPLFLIKSKVHQKKYPNGRFVSPARRQITRSGYVAGQVRKAWKKFMRRMYMRDNLGRRG
tara:strand:- start:466 stop:1251 length:786 start_codon:yes stop_codon:yes gene_type:complete